MLSRAKLVPQLPARLNHETMMLSFHSDNSPRARGRNEDTTKIKDHHNHHKFLGRQPASRNKSSNIPEYADPGGSLVALGPAAEVGPLTSAHLIASCGRLLGSRSLRSGKTMMARRELDLGFRQYGCQLYIGKAPRRSTSLLLSRTLTRASSRASPK